jgi:hypothetical protein
MNQPTITCPHCEADITLTESLAAPLIRATRKKIAEKEAEIARRESALGAKRAELAKAVEIIEQQFTTRLETERERITAEEAEKARLSWATGLESKSKEVADLHRELQESDHKLAEAQKAQTELIRRQQELVDAKRRVEDALHKAKQEAEDALKLLVSEKEEQIASLQKQMDEMELISQYLTGPGFRQRIEAIVEKFSAMQTDLDRERKAMTRLRAKREEQIRGVIESTVGMYGDLRGITGKTLEEIDGLVQIARRVEARRKRGLAPQSWLAAGLIEEARA